MKIIKVKYLENGYFEVKYSGNDPIIQDIGAIKMQVPTDPHIKDILLFLRRIKLEKITENDDFDELKYRDHEIVTNDSEEQKSERLRQLAAQMSRPQGFSPPTR
jgi:hypothetical protein